MKNITNDEKLVEAAKAFLKAFIEYGRSIELIENVNTDNTVNELL